MIKNGNVRVTPAKKVVGITSAYRLQTAISRILVYAVLIILLLLVLAPIWLLLVNATRSTYQIQQGISILPSTHLIENYDILLGRGMNLWRGLFNSTYISLLSTGLSVYFGFLTAYGLVVYDFPGKKLIYNFIVVLVLIPMQLSIIGFYHYMSKLGLVDTHAALILPSIANAGSVFFAKQYLESVVITDLIDAARIDGAGEIRIFHTIMMPLAMPGAFTLAIFGFVAAWNNFFNAFILISTLDKFTLPMYVKLLRGDIYRTEYGAIYLGLAITIVPILIMYAIFSRYIVNGIAMGSLKE